jgi:hypothetical protein
MLSSIQTYRYRFANHPDPAIRLLVRVLGDIDNTISPDYQTNIDEQGDFLYIGKSVPGTSEGEEKWQIKRLQISTVEIRYAEAKAEFIYSWDTRATYTY